ncbi:MAG: ankyrin repeat domain-containing protein [Proteobacteria bacterium]|nr:ankyrin repeat domain-containing protein [Pseudomonadota bacterium]
MGGAASSFLGRTDVGQLCYAVIDQDLERVMKAIQNIRGDENYTRDVLDTESTLDSPLFVSSRLGQNGEEVAIYFNSPTNWSEEDDTSYPLAMTALQHAIFASEGENGVRICRHLLQEGLNPDVINMHGWTSLHFACMLGDFEAVKLLLEHGANLYVETTKNVEINLSENPVLITKCSTASDIIEVLMESLLQEKDRGIGADQSEEEKAVLLNLSRIGMLLKIKRETPKQATEALGVEQVVLGSRGGGKERSSSR